MNLVINTIGIKSRKIRNNVFKLEKRFCKSDGLDKSTRDVTESGRTKYGHIMIILQYKNKLRRNADSSNILAFLVSIGGTLLEIISSNSL
jgi:hypothetical protein